MPNYKKILDTNFGVDENVESAKECATLADGKMYVAISARDVARDLTYKMFINQQWIDNLNSRYDLALPNADQISTIDQYLTVLRAFKKYDANLNGDPNDEIPVSSESLLFLRNYILQSYGYVQTGMEISDDGKSFVYVPKSEAYRNYLKTMNTMGGGNRTVGATDYTVTTLSGNIKKVVIATALQDGASGLNIYGTGASLDWYIGDMSVKLTEPAPIEAGKTPNGYEVGFNVEVNSRAFGTDASTTIVNTSESPLKDNADVTQATVTRWDVSAKWSLEWFQGAGRVELNQKYTMDFIYYVESALSGNVYLNIDNSDFRELPDGASVGFHHVVLTDQTVKSTDYFCWYVNGTPAFGTIYLASIKITLSEVVSA